MAKIIQKEELQRHNVDRYSFKVLSSNKKIQKKAQPQHTPQDENLQKESVDSKDIPQEPNEISKSSKDELIESLLKKVDDMGSNFIKLQMKLEDMQEEHKKEIEKISQEFYEKGLTEGKEIAKKELEQEYADSLNLFGNSISKLEEISNQYNTALDNLKKELAVAALDIAKEVIDIEVSQNSEEIALKLATNLIEELKDASKITIKVNPNDFVKLQNGLKEFKNIELISDMAISKGGVIAISDVENIDAQIKSRFDKVKKVVLNG